MLIRTPKTSFNLTLDDVCIMKHEKYKTWILRSEKDGSDQKGFFLKSVDNDREFGEYVTSWVSEFEGVHNIPEEIEELVYKLKEYVQYDDFDDIIDRLAFSQDYFSINKEAWYIHIKADTLIFFDEIKHFIQRTIHLDDATVKLDRKQSEQLIKAMIEYKSNKHKTTISL